MKLVPIASREAARSEPKGCGGGSLGGICCLRMRPRRPLTLRCALLSLVAAACSMVPPDPTDLDAASIEEVDLMPPQADWGGRNVAVGVAALLGGWSYWYWSSS